MNSKRSNSRLLLVIALFGILWTQFVLAQDEATIVENPETTVPAASDDQSLSQDSTAPTGVETIGAQETTVSAAGEDGETTQATGESRSAGAGDGETATSAGELSTSGTESVQPGTESKGTETSSLESSTGGTGGGDSTAQDQGQDLGSTPTPPACSTGSCETWANIKISGSNTAYTTILTVCPNKTDTESTTTSLRPDETKMNCTYDITALIQMERNPTETTTRSSNPTPQPAFRRKRNADESRTLTWTITRQSPLKYNRTVETERLRNALSTFLGNASAVEVEAVNDIVTARVPLNLTFADLQTILQDFVFRYNEQPPAQETAVISSEVPTSAITPPAQETAVISSEVPTSAITSPAQETIVISSEIPTSASTAQVPEQDLSSTPTLQACYTGSCETSPLIKIRGPSTTLVVRMTACPKRTDGVGSFFRRKRNTDETKMNCTYDITAYFLNESNPTESKNLTWTITRNTPLTLSTRVVADLLRKALSKFVGNARGTRIRRQANGVVVEVVNNTVIATLDKDLTFEDLELILKDLVSYPSAEPTAPETTVITLETPTSTSTIKTASSSEAPPVPPILESRGIWEAHFGLFLTVIILISVCVVVTCVCCLCMKWRGRDRHPDKQPIAMEEAHPAPTAVSNPISDHEMIQDEAPMQERENPAVTPNGGGQHISKADEDNGWVVPLDELSKAEKEKPEVENTRL